MIVNQPMIPAVANPITKAKIFFSLIELNAATAERIVIKAKIITNKFMKQHSFRHPISMS